MKIIVDIISRYISSGKRIVIPGLGGFLVKQPTGEVIFSEFLKQDDGVLRDELIASGMKYMEAAGAINRFVFEVRHSLRNAETQKIEGVGLLYIDETTSKIVFISSKKSPAATAKVAKPVKKEEGTISTGEQSQATAQKQAAPTQKAEPIEEEKKEEPSKPSNERASVLKDINDSQSFSGRFCDGDPIIKSLRYSRALKPRGYTPHRSKPKRRVDFVLIIAFIVLVVAIGIITYGVYLSLSAGEGNPFIQVWERIVQFFKGLFS